MLSTLGVCRGTTADWLGAGLVVGTHFFAVVSKYAMWPLWLHATRQVPLLSLCGGPSCRMHIK